MKGFGLSLTIAVFVLAIAVAGAAIAKPPPRPASATKVNICHFTGKKYVAITVSARAQQTHVQHHQDVMGATVVPQGTTKARKAAARAFCAGLSILTPTRGGKPFSATLTSTTAGLAGSIDIRARVGQGRLCLRLTVSSTTTPITVSGITILQGTTTLATLNLATLSPLTSATSPLQLSGCVNLSRSLVKQIVQTKGLTVQVTTSSPAGGVLTGTLS